MTNTNIYTLQMKVIAESGEVVERIRNNRMKTKIILFHDALSSLLMTI